MDPTERFIHDELMRRAEMGLPSILEAWKAKQHIEPFIISWPYSRIVGDDGSEIADFVLTDLPADRKRWKKLIVLTVQRVKPYALLLAEELNDCVLLIFESGHGTRSWRYPIKHHGNVRVLGDPTQRDDVDRIGILWSPKTHEA
jgi:hypothetical protein